MHTHTHIHSCIRGGVGDLLDILQHVGQGELANSYKVINNRLIQARLIYNVGLFVLPTAFGVIFS